MSSSLDLKKCILSFIEEGNSKVDVRKFFRVSKRAVFLWVKEKKEQGDLKLKVRDKKPYKIDDERLVEYLQKNPAPYLKETAASFQVSVSAIFYVLFYTIFYILRRIKITYKKHFFT